MSMITLPDNGVHFDLREFKKYLSNMEKQSKIVLLEKLPFRGSFSNNHSFLDFPASAVCAA